MRWIANSSLVLLSAIFISMFAITWNADESSALKADDITRSIRIAIFLIERTLFIAVGAKLNSLISEFITVLEIIKIIV